jgi:hypothetical protein
MEIDANRRAGLVDTGMSIFITRTLFTFLLLIAATRCGGDPGYEMRIVNASGQAVTVYELGAYQDGDRGFILAPDAIKITRWFHPHDENDRQEATIKAVNTNGAVVFCQRFSYGTAKGNFEWTVRITAGPVECS